MNALRVVAPLVLALTLSCSEETSSPTIPVEEIPGHWSGDWGHLVLRKVGGEVWGTYTYRQGTVVGQYRSEVLVGWWTEAPSRQPPGDAGEVELRFRRTDTGGLTFDGRWRFGTTGTWHEDWDLAITTEPAPPELEARFDDTALFHRHP